MIEKVLEVRGLSKVYGPTCPQCPQATDAISGHGRQANRCQACGTIRAVSNVSFDLHRGEILGIMGESGSGKSTLVKLLYGDEAPSSGRAIFYDDERAHDIFTLNAAQQRWLRHHRFGMVYQNPTLGLNYAYSAGGNIAERLLTAGLPHYGNIRVKADRLLERMGIDGKRKDESPSNFSGGMQQRVQIAKALVTDPPLLFLDEVTTGLDLSVQARILDLILELQEERGLSMIVVTHDLGVIRLLATRTLVMKSGELIESGLTDQILEDPQAAYTQELVSSQL